MNSINTNIYTNFGSYSNPAHAPLQNKATPEMSDSSGDKFEQILQQYMTAETGDYSSQG